MHTAPVQRNDRPFRGRARDEMKARTPGDYAKSISIRCHLRNGFSGGEAHTRVVTEKETTPRRPRPNSVASQTKLGSGRGLDTCPA
jgi:hypothetical protein